MSYTSYDDYIKSKTYLLDEIPSHWEIVPMNQFVNLVTDYVANGSFASLRENVEYKNEEDYAILVRLADNTNNFSGPFVYIDEDAYTFLSKSKLYEGDIVLSNTGSIGSIFKVPDLGKPMSLGPNSLLIRFDNQTLANYFFYLFSCDIGTKFLESITTVTTQPKFNKTDFRKLPMVKPPLDEQQQIANYLDKQTAKIDATIAKNEELIQLLEEKRVALINQVVTKGLDSDVPMKDSGVEWIGEIPEHWKTNKIKNMSYVKGRIGWHGLTSEEYSDEGAYLVTGTDFAEGKVDWNNCNHISYERYQQDPNIHLKENDLLITKDGTIGKLALIKDIPDKATLNSGIFLVRPLKDNYTNDYLYWILSSDIFTRFFDYIKTGATIAHLYQETFERFFFPYMDLEEQNQIVNYLNINISKINATIKKVEESITLLEEYKTSLIHHVVTGKIDVRGEEI